MFLFFDGLWEFIMVFFLLLFIGEFSLFVEDFWQAKAELRRGFTGTKARPTRIFVRHLIKFLRVEGGFLSHLSMGAKFLFLFMAAGLLPAWSGDTALKIPHSFWVFVALVVIGPVMQLVLEWGNHKGTSWPSVLASTERTIGGITVHLILSGTLIAMTGLDNFSDYREMQLKHTWLIFRYPWAITLFFAYLVLNLSMSLQTIFSRSTEERATGWSLEVIIPELRRTIWTLFIVDVFLGGGGDQHILGNISLIIKCVAVNVFSRAGAQLFVKLREDQAESFILWQLTPAAIVILVISLLIPGGLG